MRGQALPCRCAVRQMRREGTTAWASNTSHSSAPSPECGMWYFAEVTRFTKGLPKDYQEGGVVAKEVQSLGEVHRGVSRRTIAKGAAWTVPAVAVAAAAPVAAASIVKYPGINGWVLNSPRKVRSTRWPFEDLPCQWTLEVDSTVAGNDTPDGAPFGLYLYDVEPENTFSNASFTYWIIGTQQSNITWATLSGHSPCWGIPTRGTAVTKTDGVLYTPYTWTYTCAINASSYALDPIDNRWRLYLGDFHVRATFTQDNYDPPPPGGQWGSSCENVTYWSQRRITVDPDGTGPAPAENKCFERRNGTMGMTNPSTVFC